MAIAKSITIEAVKAPETKAVPVPEWKELLNGGDEVGVKHLDSAEQITLSLAMAAGNHNKGDIVIEKLSMCIVNAENEPLFPDGKTLGHYLDGRDELVTRLILAMGEMNPVTSLTEKKSKS